MIELYTPNNLKSNVPENVGEDETPRFNINEEMNNALKYYMENGYVIFSSCITKELCDELRNLWKVNVKNFKGKIYRQTNAKAEKNIFNKNNWVMNPVLNLQSLNPNLFGSLRNTVDKSVFANNNICKALNLLLGEKPTIVQSMYFEGNSATWEHQDTYYLDSENIGKMTAGWLALEEIKANAGRFFICPMSHKIDLGKHNKLNNIAENHDKYIEQVVSIIKSNKISVKAPYMAAGDVLFWNSRTIHGSLDSQSNEYSRSSITMHAIPSSDKFLQFQIRKTTLKTEDLGNSYIYRPKDQSKFNNRLVLKVESIFPNLFYWLKKKIIKILIKN